MQDDNENRDNSGKLPRISFSAEEKGGLSNADAFLAILIPAVGECYRRWDPVNVRMSWQTFYAYFSHNMDFAPEVYQSQRQGYEFDIRVLDEIDVPHIKETVPILAAAIEQCRSIWTTADAPHGPFISIAIHYLYTIANKMYRAGMKAAGLMNNSDRDIDIIAAGESRKISFSAEEIQGFPNADAALAIFVPVAQKCCRLWDPVNARIGQQTFSAYFNSSMYAALQVCLRGEAIDFSDIIESDVPHIEEAAFILETAIEQCYSIWTEADFNSLAFTHMVGGLMHLAALKVYSYGRNDPNLLSGFPTLQMISLSEEEKSAFPDADYVLDILISLLQKCYRLWDPFHAGTDERTFLTHLTRSIHAALQVYSDQQAGNEANLDFLAKIDVPYIETAVPILATGFEKCRLVWTEADFDHEAFVSMVSRYMGIIGFKMYRNG